MAGILELLRGTTDPTTPGTGLGDIYFKGATDAAMLLYFRRPDGTVVELAPSSGGLVLPSAGGTGIANNNASTLAITGAFATTVTVTGTTGVTLPTSGTLVNSAVATLSSLTSVGALNSGSITSGFGSIDIGSDALTAGATGVTTLTASSTVTGTALTANGATAFKSVARVTTEDAQIAFYANNGTTLHGLLNSGANILEWYDGTVTRILRVRSTGLDVAGEGTFTGAITSSGGATFHTTSTALTNGAGVGLGTMTNAPAAGNPTKWIGINDNGTTRYIPAW